MNYLYSLWCACALCGCSLESFRVLQSCGYRPSRGYFKLLLTGYFGVLVLCQAFSWFWAGYFPIEAVLCGVYTLVFLPFAFVRRKSPLKFTKRVMRMLCVQLVLLFVACLFALHLWVMFLPLFTLVSWALCLPVDCVINKKYLKSAQDKLTNSNVTVIAITGSYGKTSVKDMLCALLSDSLAPQGSCNTPLGIAKFVNSADFSRVKYLVLEFGARKRGDIAALCRLYRPQFGIVTGVCAQHLSTFKTLNNVAATKRELVECLPPDGFCLLGDSSVHEFATVGSCKKIISGTMKVAQCTLSEKGLQFVACCKKKHQTVKLPQICRYSAENFALCASFCVKLGQSFETTVANSARVKQTPHRMEISHNGKFYIVDDSYNASEKGVEGCCKTLSEFSCVKVVVSQGIVEGGSSQKELNERCGEMLGSVCDMVIVVGKNSKSLMHGAEKSSCGKIVRAKNLRRAVAIAQEYLPRNGILLFQNDLPDVANV